MNKIKALHEALSSNRLVRYAILFITDISIFCFSFVISYWMFNPRLQLGFILDTSTFSFIAMSCIIKIGILLLLDMYKKHNIYGGLVDVVKILSATVVFFVMDFVIMIQTGVGGNGNVGVIILTAFMTFTLLFLTRFSFYINRKFDILFNEKNKKRVMVVGAGTMGEYTIDYINNQVKMEKRVVVAIDDDKRKHKKKLLGVEIAGGRNKIPEVAKRYKIDEIIISIASARRRDIRAIIDLCNSTGVSVTITPQLYEIIDGHKKMSHTRKVNIYDLLGREEVKIDNQSIAKLLEGKCVMVTGGGGSIGSELCRQILNYSPRTLVIFDIYENTTYELENEIKAFLDMKKTNVIIKIGSVRDVDRLESVMREYNINIVFHAAAHKHVSLMEKSPVEAIKNNILGTYNAAVASDKLGVEKFVLISTDKAVNPTSIMGATKRMAELVIQDMNKVSKTEFVAVRFGNVLGSNGSVIPLFLKLIERGLPITVTHPDVTRYFMTIPEASQLVLQAGSMANGGEIFILDMGEPVKILDLAENLIKLMGMKPYDEVPIVFSGLTAGEKLHEELVMKQEDLQETQHEKIYVVKPVDEGFVLKKELKRLNDVIKKGGEITVEDVIGEKYCPTAE